MRLRRLIGSHPKAVLDEVMERSRSPAFLALPPASGALFRTLLNRLNREWSPQETEWI
jgi:hypothetical protein